VGERKVHLVRKGYGLEGGPMGKRTGWVNVVITRGLKGWEDTTGGRERWL